MHQHHATLRLLIIMVSLLLIGAAVYALLMFGLSGSASSTATSTSSSPVSSATSSTPSAVVSVPVVTPPTTPTKPGTPVTPTPKTVVITTADNNTSISLVQGQKFMVQLGDGLHWTITVSPSGSVTQIAGETGDGSQGTYEASAPGTVTVKGSGAPICNAEQACPQFLALFTATLDIK